MSQPAAPSDLRERGFALHEHGDLDGAQAIYREILRLAPEDSEIKAAFGVVALQAGRYAAAIEAFMSTIGLNETAALHCYLGNAFSGLCRLEEALDSYDKAIALQPDYVAAHINRGHALRSLGRFPEAILSYDRTIELSPQFFEAFLSRAEVLFAVNDWPRSLANYDAAIALRPDHPSARIHRSTLLLKLRRWSTALEAVEQAMILGDASADALLNRAIAQQGLGLSDKALASYREALVLDPTLAAAWLGAAEVLLTVPDAAQSLVCADRALEIRKPLPQAWFTKAAALQELGRSQEALEAVEKALSERPEYAEALIARAYLLYARGDHRGAIESFREAIRCDPDADAARIGIAIAQIPPLPATVDEAVASRAAFYRELLRLSEDLCSRPSLDATSLVGALQPFVLAYQQHDNRGLLSLYGRICAESMENWQVQAGLPRPKPRATGASKIRIAVVSGQICDSSVYNALTRGWLKLLDRSRFQIEVFYAGTRRDTETEIAQSWVDHFESGQRSVLEWAGSILSRQPDVIIYPEVGMDRITMQLASQRLAPVQAASWGHPETTGLPTLDYYLSGEAFEPPDAEDHYSERLVRLPNLGCYYEPYVERPPYLGPTLAVDRSGPLFVCAGSPYKYAPEHDRLFVEIARRLGRCRFHFFSFKDGLLTARLAKRLAGAFSAAGLDGARHLVIHPWSPRAQFHEFLGAADLMLDTLGFSGFNTAVQALECNLPVVAHRGKFLRGRLGMALLERAGLHELIVDTPDEYVERVVAIAQDPHERARLRGKIRSGVPRVCRDEQSIAGLESFLTSAVESRAPPATHRVRG